MNAKFSVQNIGDLPPISMPTPTVEAGLNTLISELKKWGIK